eukprot:3850392-Amphidinium_carterae.1
MLLHELKILRVDEALRSTQGTDAWAFSSPHGQLPSFRCTAMHACPTLCRVPQHSELDAATYFHEDEAME